jgi:hypothetical protein
MIKTKEDIASQMRKLVEEFHNSGSDQKHFAEANGISNGKLHYWIKKLSLPSSFLSSEATSNFVPITLTSKQEAEARSIIIRCTSGVEIEIPL